MMKPSPRHLGERNERTYLLIKPSPSSTDRRSSSDLLSYDDETGSLVAPRSREGSLSPSIQLPMLHRHQKEPGDLYSSYGSDNKGRRLLLFGSLVLVLGFVVLFGLPFQLHKKAATSPSMEPPSNEVKPTKAFSTLDPVIDLGLVDYDRPSSTKPSAALVQKNVNRHAFPTNAWYQNLLLLLDDDGGKRPQQIHRAYAIPYVLDAAGPIPGVRVQPNHIGGSTNQYQVNLIDTFGLTLGVAGSTDADEDFRYHVLQTTPLGITMEWDVGALTMQSSIVRGMPYATMEYKNWSGKDSDGALPTIASQIELERPPIADGKTVMACDHSEGNHQSSLFLVEKEMELLFDASDFTWLVFPSEPVLFRCIQKGSQVLLQVVEAAAKTRPKETDLVLRVALLEQCSTNSNPIYCHQEQLDHTALRMGQGRYRDILRQHAGTFPGANTSFSFSVEGDSIEMVFDWDAHYTKPVTNTTGREIIAYALPHHFDILSNPIYAGAWDEKYCESSLLGPACLLVGSTWKLKDTAPETSFRSPRAPEPHHLASISQSLRDDIRYTLPDFYRRGAGDTYFSGKMLAKLGRILLVAEELLEMCSSDSVTISSRYKNTCGDIWLPSTNDFQDALSELRSSVEIWINGTAEIPFVFDPSWGGVVSCGCLFDGMKCTNKFPDCPAFNDPGLNFGNAYYNDMHFHYGYHIYAAAIVAHFDHDWGRRYFENVLLLARTIANPDTGDKFFVPWRHKDWFQGHSWASGMATSPLNGRNQESSSEAIAAYEAVALYGGVMLSAWREVGAEQKVAQATSVKEAGQVLVASELLSARWYWHVIHNKDSGRVVPSVYKPHVVGIMWQTMAQFQTWFGAAPYLAYGIQMIPLTPIAEARDNVEWAKSMYSAFAESCEADERCLYSGWRILQLAMLATIGEREVALKSALDLKDDVFEDAGGNGHSRTNTLWYIATRPEVKSPLASDHASMPEPSPEQEPSSGGASQESVIVNCGVPLTCTDYVLDTIADIYSCRQRMEWLTKSRGYTEKAACIQVASIEFPKQCGLCNPFLDNAPDSTATRPVNCPPCSEEECTSPILTRCPRYEETYVCTSGSSFGGCSGSQWQLSPQVCSSCCELTDCPARPFGDSDGLGAPVDESDCPACTREECMSPKNLCPTSGPSAPFFCTAGGSSGGCSPTPWSLGVDCDRCCKVTPDCT